MIPSILEDAGSLEVKYPQAEAFTSKQLSVFWLPDEAKVEKDMQDMLVNLTEAERHGVITTLKLFTMYELKIGAEYWGGRFKNSFKRVEFQEMGATFSMFELAVHKRFYQKINELLHLHNDEFYNSYVEDPVLVERMKFIDAMISSPDELESLAAFSMIEGVVLYSAFTYLKHFQSQGKNKLLNIVRGINFTLRDENIHAVAGAWTFATLKSESNLTPEQEATLEAKVIANAEALCNHECRIIDMIFEKGPIDGITPVQMKRFVESRVNECLINLGYKKLYEVTYNPIASWFYKAISDFIFNDTFSGVGNSYHRNWESTGFTWGEYSEKQEQPTLEVI